MDYIPHISNPPPPRPHPPPKDIYIPIQISIENQIKEIKTMKKIRKKQEDRLLKQLPLRDRQRQLWLRQQIMEDTLFIVV